MKWDEGENADIVLRTLSIREQMKNIVEKYAVGEDAGKLKTIEAVYETPYLVHAAMEPVNCIADVRPDKVEIWAPTQNACRM